MCSLGATISRALDVFDFEPLPRNRIERLLLLHTVE